MSAASSALDAFIMRCDPSSVPPVGTFVERTRPLAPRLLSAVEPSSTCRVLVVGQTGVGKSAELARFAEIAKAKFTVVTPPVDSTLLMHDDWHEIFVFSAAWAAENLFQSPPVSARTLASALEPPREEKVSLLEPTVKRGGPPEPTTTQRFRNDYLGVRRVIATGRAQYWDLAKAVIRDVEQRTGKEVILVLDGLEKLADDVARRLFYEKGRLLHDFPMRLVVTAPISLSFTEVFGDIEERFLVVERQRALSCQPGEPGFEFFSRIAAHRGANAVFASDMLKDTVSWGGGLPRQFLQLLAAAATQARADGLSSVSQECLVRGRRKVTEKWHYQLKDTDYPELIREQEAAAAGQVQPTNEARSRLLRIGALIEYEKEDGSLKWGINPLVGVLLSRFKRESA